MSEVAGGESFDGENTNRFVAAENNRKSSGVMEENIPWVDYAVQQAQIAQKTVEITVENAIEATRSRLDRILTTSSAHFNQTIDSLQDIKSDYSSYEDIAFGKIKEGILVASSNPLITAGTVLGVGFLGLKRTRQFLHYNSMRLFLSEEALISRADAKVKELRQSIDLLMAESNKLEKASANQQVLNKQFVSFYIDAKRALQAEDNLVRGRTKLRQTGKQIQSVINSAYKIERQAAGLKDVLKELPSREASRFRTQVTNLAKEAKKEKNALSKEVTKISNYGISV